MDNYLSLDFFKINDYTLNKIYDEIQDNSMKKIFFILKKAKIKVKENRDIQKYSILKMKKFFLIILYIINYYIS